MNQVQEATVPREIEPEDFEGLTVNGEIAIARYFGLELKRATRENLIEKTLDLSRQIREKALERTPTSLRQAAELLRLKLEIATILENAPEEAIAYDPEGKSTFIRNHEVIGIIVDLKPIDFEGMTVLQEIYIANTLGLGITDAKREDFVPLAIALTEEIDKLMREAEGGKPDAYDEAAALVAKQEKIISVLFEKFNLKDELSHRSTRGELAFTPPNRGLHSLSDFLTGILSEAPEVGEQLLSEIRAMGIKADQIEGVSCKAELKLETAGKTIAEQRALYAHGLLDPVQTLVLVAKAYMSAREKGVNLDFLEQEETNIRPDRIYRESLRKGVALGTATLLRALTAGGVRFGDSLTISFTESEFLISKVEADAAHPTEVAIGIP